jgi:hypothetical protein
VDGIQKPDLTAPGASVISLRDRDVIKNPSVSYPISLWIDNDDVAGGDTSYYVMQGTSMACPMAAGTAALLLQKFPTLTPEEVYSTLRDFARSDSYTGPCPNSSWGQGKLNIDSVFTSTVLVETKMILEGPYVATHDTMSTILKKNNNIPLTSPYYQDSRTIVLVPNNIVDWVLVQLRSTANGPVIASKSALLRKDGRIVADDGITERIILSMQSGSYFLLLRHRNHCSVMSATATALNNSSSELYDFTTGSNKYYGINGYKTFISGKTGFYAGDSNSDGGVYSEDYTQYRTTQGQEGYRPADFNLDGGVYAEDYTIYKRNQGCESTVP